MPAAGRCLARLLLCQTAQSPDDGWFTPLNAGPGEAGDGAPACTCRSSTCRCREHSRCTVSRHCASGCAIRIESCLQAPSGGSGLPPASPALSPHGPRQSQPEPLSPSHLHIPDSGPASGLPGELPTVQGRHSTSSLELSVSSQCPACPRPRGWARRGLHVCFDNVLLCLELVFLFHLLCDLGM